MIENTKNLGLVILSGGNCCFNLSFCALVPYIFFCFLACMLYFNSIYENPFFKKDTVIMLACLDQTQGQNFKGAFHYVIV